MSQSKVPSTADPGATMGGSGDGEGMSDWASVRGLRSILPLPHDSHMTWQNVRHMQDHFANPIDKGFKPSGEFIKAPGQRDLRNKFLLSSWSREWIEKAIFKPLIDWPQYIYPILIDHELMLLHGMLCCPHL